MADFTEQDAQQSLGIISQGINAYSQQTQGKLKAAKAKYDQLYEERNKYLDFAANPDFDPAVRMDFWNKGTAIQNMLDPKNPLPAVDNFDGPVAAVLNARNVMNKMRDKGLIKQEQIDSYMSELITQQSKKAKPQETEFMMSLQYGSGSPIETTGPNGPVLSKSTPAGEMVPMTQRPGLGAPVTKPPEPLSGEAAGRATGAQSAITDVQEIRGLLFGETGKLDRGALITGKLNIPFSKGREANQRMQRAIETKLRIDTGANAPPQERKNLLNQFGVKIGDNDKFAAEKLDRLEDIMANYLFQLDPNGKLQLIPKGEGKPASTPGGLTPEERKEFEALDKRFGNQK